MPGTFPPRRRFQRKPLVSDPGMHHGTCVTHVPWCMSGSLTCGDGENVPGIPGACAPAILRIWQEAHDVESVFIWVGSRRCGYHVTWFGYWLIAKPGNKTVTPPWRDPNHVVTMFIFQTGCSKRTILQLLLVVSKWDDWYRSNWRLWRPYRRYCQSHCHRGRRYAGNHNDKIPYTRCTALFWLINPRYLRSFFPKEESMSCIMK